MKSIQTYNNETVKHKILKTNMYKQRLRISYVTDRYLVQFYWPVTAHYMGGVYYTIFSIDQPVV